MEMELDRPLYLASASPRRIELVRQLGLHARVCPADVDESAEGNPGKRVLELARRKALHVAGQHQRGLVLGADTLVSIGRRVLGKPRDEEQAFEMLRALCGHWHRVYTGVCLADCQDGRVACAVESAMVHMLHLSDEEIFSYIRSGEPMDKAGAYGIQGLGGSIVDCIRGDYYAVMGLPLAKTRQLLGLMGVSVL